MKIREFIVIINEEVAGKSVSPGFGSETFRMCRLIIHIFKDPNQPRSAPMAFIVFFMFDCFFVYVQVRTTFAMLPPYHPNSRIQLSFETLWFNCFVAPSITPEVSSFKLSGCACCLLIEDDADS